MSIGQRSTDACRRRPARRWEQWTASSGRCLERTVLVVGVIRFVNDLRRRHPDRPRSDTTVDMATGEVAGQSIAAAIAAFLEQLF